MSGLFKSNKRSPVLDSLTGIRYRSKTEAGKELAARYGEDPKDSFVWYKILKKATERRFIDIQSGMAIMRDGSLAWIDRRSRFYIPSKNPEDWKLLLAEPERQWRTGHSAKALAYCWEVANDFPPEVKQVFQKSGISLFQHIQMLVAFPEYKVPLPGGKRASQSDIFILAKSNEQLVSITIEGKVSEPFGETITEWKTRDKGGKKIRLEYLCQQLGLDNSKVDHIRYQLLHRTVSAVIEARKFNASNALMLVHSFSQTNEWFDDYRGFLALFGVEAQVDSLVYAKDISGIDLYFGWVKGNKKYLEY